MPSPTVFPTTPSGGSVSFPRPNDAVEAARQRRVSRAGEREAKIVWTIEEVSQRVAIDMRKRVTLATHLLKDRVIRNISTPNVKGTGPRGGRVVTGRSVAGEFPHVETGQLLRTIFEEIKEIAPGDYEGYVGTPLPYGLELEVRMNRSFLRRTHEESLDDLRSILTGPVA